MDTIKLRARIETRGELHLSNLPFGAGEEVEITLRPVQQNGQDDAFWRSASLAELAIAHPIAVSDFDKLLGDRHEDDDVDDFLVAREHWRREDIESQK